MVDCRTFAVVCSIACISSCIGSIYLISTVNPPPLAVPDETQQKDTESIAPRDPLALNSLTPFYRYSPAKLASIANMDPPDKEDSEEVDPIFVFPLGLIRNVVPPPRYFPINKNNTILTTTVVTTGLSVESDNYDPNKEAYVRGQSDIPIPDTKPVAISSDSNSDSAPSVKGLRRSVKNFANKIIDGNASSVVMNIVDKNGQSRIEIKLNPELSDLLEIGSNLVMLVQKNNNKEDVFDLGYNTEIKILPNDTVFITNIEEYLNVTTENTINNTENIADIFNPIQFSIMNNITDTEYEKEIARTAVLTDVNLINGNHKNTFHIIHLSEPGKQKENTSYAVKVNEPKVQNTSSSYKDKINDLSNEIESNMTAVLDDTESIVTDAITRNVSYIFTNKSKDQFYSSSNTTKEKLLQHNPDVTEKANLILLVEATQLKNTNDSFMNNSIELHISTSNQSEITPKINKEHHLETRGNITKDIVKNNNENFLKNITRTNHSDIENSTNLISNSTSNSIGNITQQMTNPESDIQKSTTTEFESKLIPNILYTNETYSFVTEELFTTIATNVSRMAQ